MAKCWRFFFYVDTALSAQTQLQTARLNDDAFKFYWYFSRFSVFSVFSYLSILYFLVVNGPSN